MQLQDTARITGTVGENERFVASLAPDPDHPACLIRMTSKGGPRRAKKGNSGGYTNFNRDDGTECGSHVFAMERAIGRTLTDGERVLHHCDNPPCCEASHLFLGTQKDNIADMRSKGRDRFGGRVGSHLTPEIVRAIRAMYATGAVTQEQLASDCKVDQTTISAIIRRRLWPQVD